jgi:outer membrane protein assembly factor BamD (BamD/ComL family)
VRENPNAMETRGRSLLAAYLAVFAFAQFFAPGCAAWESFRQRSDNLKHTLFDDGWEDNKVPEEMAEGEAAFADGRYKKAAEVLKKVADNKNNNTEVAERARFIQAESRRLLGEWPDAVDTYHRLLMDFPTGTHRREACKQMYDIAEYWLSDFKTEIEKRANEKGVLHRTPGWPNPFDKTKPAIDQEGRALEAMENIHTQDIMGPLADKALFWCGFVTFVRGDFVKSERYFSELVEMHKDSPLRPTATYYAIQAKNNATGGAIYDGRKCAEALQLIHTAEATMPELSQDRDMADKLTRAKFAIRSQQAEKDFRMAEYYERTGHPGSAVFYYELVRRRFPGTRYADIAVERKEYLLKLLNEGHPSVGTDPFAIARARWDQLIGKKPPVPESQQQTPAANNTLAQVAGLPPGALPGGGIVPGQAYVAPPTGVIPGGGVTPGRPAPGVQTGVVPGGGVVPLGQQAASTTPAAATPNPYSPPAATAAPALPPPAIPGSPVGAGSPAVPAAGGSYSMAAAVPPPAAPVPPTRTIPEGVIVPPPPGGVVLASTFNAAPGRVVPAAYPPAATVAPPVGSAPAPTFGAATSQVVPVVYAPAATVAPAVVVAPAVPGTSSTNWVPASGTIVGQAPVAAPVAPVAPISPVAPATSTTPPVTNWAPAGAASPRP